MTPAGEQSSLDSDERLCDAASDASMATSGKDAEKSETEESE